MFSTLLKHEMKSLWHYTGIVVICVLIASVLFELGMISVFLIPNYIYDTVMVPTLIFLFFTITVALSYGVVFAVAYRFYRSMASDEGYLTHTLPVTVNELIGAKLFAGTVYTICSLLYIILFIILTAVIAVLVSGASDSIPEVLKDLEYVYKEIKENIPLPLFVYFIEFIIVGLFSSIYSNVVIFLCVALGQLMKKHKLIWSVVYYMLVTFVLQGLIQMGSTILGMVFGNGIERYVERVGVDGFVTVSQIIILVAFLVFAILSVCGYFITKYIFERKLNLE
ncbi:MAG: hypothetical protein K5656_07315 [Lachnospiraceae bacterium]|nr:hypothetical protein [Lachnospiraceae bacterium]